MKFPIFQFLLIVLLIGATQSCKKLSKYSDPSLIAPSSWDPQLAAPIAYADFGVYDILARTDSSELIVIDKNSGQIALVYKGEVISVKAEDIISLPEINHQITNSTADLGLPSVPSFSGNASLQTNQEVTFPVASGIEFHTVVFKSGTIALEFTSDLKHDITITISFPYLLKNGIPLSATLTGNYTAGPITISGSIDLTDVTGSFTNAGSTVNTLVMDLHTSIDGTGEEIDGSETIVMDAAVTNPTYRNATGYFGQQDLGNYADSILIKIFNTSTQGYFELVNPKVKLEMINSFGFPVEIVLSNLKSINVNTGTELPLTGFANPIEIGSPTILGESKTTVLELNNTNTTNISSVISPAPKYFYFEVAGTANPLGPGSNLNFVQDTSRFKINAELELPLEGFGYGFEVTDTVEFSFNEDASQIESIGFRLIVNNGFPVNLDANITFVDENYQPLFSLTDDFDLVVASGEINTSGEVVSRTQKITDLVADEAEIGLLKNAKHILLNAKMETTNGTNNEVIKVLDYYRIGLQLGMKVKLNINVQ
ncbi:MAG: hypothetical protein AB8B74_09855 [Crocinitomicaceae bacterium]